VRRLAKIILAALVSVALLGGMLVLGINLYVQSAAVQAKVERRLSDETRVPVRLTSTIFTPWDGLKITGVTIPAEPGEPSRGNFLETESINAEFLFSPLFRKRFVVRSIVIERPKVTWFQNEEGKWKLPGSTAESDSETGQIAIAPPALPSISMSPPPATRAENSTTTPRKNVTVPDHRSLPGFATTIKRVSVHGGSFDFRAIDGSSVASFHNVEIDSPKIKESRLAGTATCAVISIHDAVFLQNVTTKFAHASAVMSLDDVHAKSAGGNLTGNFSIDTRANGSPYQLAIRFSEVDLNRMISEAGGPSGRATGLLDGTFDLRGDTEDKKKAVGRGSFGLTHGWIRQYEFFQMLSTYLNIEELAELNLEKAHADFRIADGKILVDQLLLQTPNLNLVITGKIKLDGKLNLDARLTVDPKISRRLPDFIGRNFIPVENSQSSYIDFDITGTMNKPKTNIRERLLGRKLEQEVTSFFQNLIQKKKGARKPEAAPQQASEPGASPATE
jgi:type II secretion system protein N